MAKGKVKWYNDIKGYGFINGEDDEDIFVHRSGLANSVYNLETDQEVEFDIRDGEKGKVAVNVKIAE